MPTVTHLCIVHQLTVRSCQDTSREVLHPNDFGVSERETGVVQAVWRKARMRSVLAEERRFARSRLLLDHRRVARAPHQAAAEVEALLAVEAHRPVDYAMTYFDSSQCSPA